MSPRARQSKQRVPAQPNGRRSDGVPRPLLQRPGAGEQTRSALERTITVLRRRWILVLVCALLVPLTALVFSLTQEERYEASAFLLFRDPGLDQRLFGTGFFPAAEDPDRAAETNLKLVSLDAVADRTAAALDRPGVSGGTVAAGISVSEEGQSDLVDIVAEDPDPRLAALMANTFAEQFIEFRRDADRSRVQEAKELIQSQLDQLTATERAGDEGLRLQQRAEELDVLSSLQTGNAELVQRAEPPSDPSSPKTRRNVVLGLLLGLVLGVGLAFLREQLDRRIRDADEIQRITGLPLLASVPHVPSLTLRHAVRSQSSRTPSDEAFRMLRANLRYFNVDRRIDSILVTSAAPRDGKTTVCWNLALAEARSDKRVLLIEADLRRPTLASGIGVAPTGGLSLVLSGEGTLADSVVSADEMAINWVDGVPKLDVLFAGPAPPNPTELIESKRMESLLREATGSYDLVIIDSPPTAIVADAIPLTRLVSGVVMVARIGQSTTDATIALYDQLTQLSAPVLGTVVNDASAPQATYYNRPPVTA